MARKGEQTHVACGAQGFLTVKPIVQWAYWYEY